MPRPLLLPDPQDWSGDLRPLIADAIVKFQDIQKLFLEKASSLPAEVKKSEAGAIVDNFVSNLDDLVVEYPGGTLALG